MIVHGGAVVAEDIVRVTSVTVAVSDPKEYRYRVNHRC